MNEGQRAHICVSVQVLGEFPHICISKLLIRTPYIQECACIYKHIYDFNKSQWVKAMDLKENGSVCMGRLEREGRNVIKI